MTLKQKAIIGSNTLIDIVGIVKGVPAKVDTGADSSAIWATDISVNEDGTLSFVLFGKKSPFYTGKVLVAKKYTVAGVVSSSGHREIRYRVTLPVRINGRRVAVNFNLSNRSVHRFPVLIGKRTLSGKFLVDVSQSAIKVPVRKTLELNKEMSADPYKFFRKYHNSAAKVKE